MTELRVAVIAVALTLGCAVEGWAAGLRCDPPPPFTPRILTATNCVYEVAINDGAGGVYGSYGASTGPAHPVTTAYGRQSATLGGGRILSASNNAISIRSWASRTDYLFDGAWSVLTEDEGFVCKWVGDLPRPAVSEIRRADGQLIGWRSVFEVQEGDDHFGLAIEILAHGEGFEDSAVEITTTVENLAREEARIGIRYYWNLEVMGISSLAFGAVPPEPPEEPWTIVDSEWVAPPWDRFLLSLWKDPSKRDYYYFSAASLRGPWPLDPPPTPPHRLVYADSPSADPNRKNGPGNVCFQWHVPDPPVGNPHGRAGMETIVYYWGDEEESALVLGPGESTSVTQWVWAFIENPVTCDAGAPYPPTECEGLVTQVRMDGSGSHTEEGNPLLHRWSSEAPEVSFDDPEASSPLALLPGPGEYPMRLDVGIGPYVRDCGAEVEVEDTTPPELKAPTPLVLRTSDHGPTSCDLPATLRAEAEDVCWGDAEVTHTTDPYLGDGGAVASYLFPPGTTRVIYRAEDPSGNVATAETTVTVIDDTPPVFTLLEAAPDVLWPPNHKMVEVGVEAEVWDNCDASPAITLLEVTSSEPEDDRGDGHTLLDIEGADPGTPDFEVLLRAERDGRGPGRTYTLRYRAEDEWGNRAEGQTAVVVPHDLGSDRE